MSTFLLSKNFVWIFKLKRRRNTLKIHNTANLPYTCVILDALSKIQSYGLCVNLNICDHGKQNTSYILTKVLIKVTTVIVCG